MPTTYREFRQQTKRRKRRRQLLCVLLFLLVFAAVAALAWKLRLRDLFAQRAESVPAVSQSAAAESAPAAPESEPASEPVAEPVAQTLAQVDNSAWNTGVPIAKTLNTALLAADYRILSVPQGRPVERSYFDTATFVGDSLTQGLQLYTTGLPNAHYCAYKGTGPNAIVNGATLTRADGGTEICLDALVASQPDYVYILLGTNSLVSVGNDDSFINYYGAMIDQFKAALDPRVVYYVQAIPAVGANVKSTKPGLDNERIRNINTRLAQLATEKGCYFLDLQEALTGADGNQIPEYAAADDIHMNATGYQAWVDYLASHVVYDRRYPYVDGDPNYIPQ